MLVITFFDENAHCPLSYSHQSPRTINVRLSDTSGSARDSLPPPVLPNSCLLSQDANQVLPAPGERRLLRAHVGPCTARLTSCRHGIQLSLSWTLRNLQEDTIWNLCFYSQCLRQHLVQEQTQIFVKT